MPVISTFIDQHGR